MFSRAIRRLPMGAGSSQIKASGRLFSTSVARQVDFSHVVSQCKLNLMLILPVQDGRLSWLL